MSALPPFELAHPRTELPAVDSDEQLARERFSGRPIGPETQIVAGRFRVVEQL